jgi:UDP-glucose 4-epimerase
MGPVFVSGIAGLLGSNLARHLCTDGVTVVGCDNLVGGYRDNVPEGARFLEVDCHDVETLAAAMSGCEVVFHCAALAHEGLSNFSPTPIVQSIVTATSAMITAAIRARVKRFIFCSSMARYGRQPPPFDERLPTAPLDPYGVSKVAAEELVRCLCQLHGLEYVIVAPHNIFGVGQRYDDPHRNVLAIMVNRLLLGKPPIIYGDGSQLRAFTPIQDAVLPLAHAGWVDRAAGEVINIGPGPEHAVSVLEVARRVMGILGVDATPTFLEPRPNEVHEATCTAEKARLILGYEPIGDLDAELRRMADWIRARGPREFDYRTAIEIPSPLVPRAWRERLL